LWLELAQVRLAQGQYAQAITLARKSNSFSGHQPRVQAGNWQVIGQARVAQGDSAGAEQAFKLSAELAQQAKAEADRGSVFNFQ
jgi:predicted negative regulator of RcsB-dependent stress response